MTRNNFINLCFYFYNSRRKKVPPCLNFESYRHKHKLLIPVNAVLSHQFEKNILHQK